MKTSEELLSMSIQDVAQAIEDHNKDTDILYESMASKITKKTNGVMTMNDDKVNVVEYWLKVARTQRKILSMDFDLAGFEEAYIGFKFMVDLVTDNGSLTAKLKTARDIASSDCFFFCSIVRKTVKAKEKEPVFALIVEKEPSPRQSKKKTATPAPDASKTEVAATTA